MDSLTMERFSSFATAAVNSYNNVASSFASLKFRRKKGGANRYQEFITFSCSHNNVIQFCTGEPIPEAYYSMKFHRFIFKMTVFFLGKIRSWRDL